MRYQADEIVFKLKVLAACTVVLISILLLSVLLLPFLENSTVRAESNDTSYTKRVTYSSANPNVVAVGMGSAFSGLGQSLGSIDNHVTSGLLTVATASAKTGQALIDGTRTGVTFTVRSIGNGLAITGNAIGSGILFVVRAPGNILESASNAPVVRSVITPADKIDVPIIDPESPAIQEAIAYLPPEESGTQAPQVAHASTGPIWPLHGRVTTEFGVPHWPYQPTHSGIDISTGNYSGVALIKPFRAGRVIETVYSDYGLGNHVVVDHGNGISSVYAHLKTIAVHEGQEVSQNTTLGTEGSTGASTGPHLHFEVRINGQATDPRQFVYGQP